MIYSNGDFLTLEIFRQYVKLGAEFLITQHDNRMPPHLQRIMDQQTAEERKHLVIRFARELFMNNRSGLVAAPGATSKALTAPCDWPLATMVITMKGDVVPCCNDYFETEVVGSVATHSLREVWCSEPAERFRRALSRGDRTAFKLCSNCDYVPSQSQQLRIVAQ